MANSKQKVLAFDVDDTLAVGPRPGPVTLDLVQTVRDQGNIVGVCGNFPVLMQNYPKWYTIFSFFGGHYPFNGYKPQFLKDMQLAILAGNPHIKDFVLIGNPKAEAEAGYVAPTSNDDGAARLASWRFINARDFAEGVR